MPETLKDIFATNLPMYCIKCSDYRFAVISKVVQLCDVFSLTLRITDNTIGKNGKSFYDSWPEYNVFVKQETDVDEFADWLDEQEGFDDLMVKN